MMMHCTLDTTTTETTTISKAETAIIAKNQVIEKNCPKLEEMMASDQEQANAAFSDMCLDDRYSPSFVPEIALHVDDQESMRSEWCLDSGCSKHITYDKDDLADYK